MLSNRSTLHPYAAQLACGDKEGAKKTQSNMTKGLPVVSQVGDSGS